MRPAFLLLLISFSAAFAQDERRVTSPNGQLEFRIFVANQEDTSLSRIAYQVWSKDKCIVKTSFMGLDIWEQEPLLGENVGLVESIPAKRAGYNSLLARYLQNGSTGRSINVEIRAYDDAVAFRYIVPSSNMLETIFLNDETTEFIVQDRAAVMVEAARQGFPAMHLTTEDGDVQRVRLRRPEGGRIVLEAPAPLTFPWRVVLTDRHKEPDILAALQQGNGPSITPR